MSRVSEGLAFDSENPNKRVVALSTGTTRLDPSTHANKLLTIAGGATPTTINMPKAVGSGDIYEFLLLAAQTSGSIIINATHWDVSNVFVGRVHSVDTSNAVVNVYASTANDIITLDGDNKGGVTAGDYIKMMDVGVVSGKGTWRIIEAFVTNAGDTPATPFSG